MDCRNPPMLGWTMFDQCASSPPPTPAKNAPITNAATL